jgi:PHD/YefM family antitoxin component YafN of YafNO toxin-antitoxin module
MRVIDILGKSRTIKVGKEPVVLVPLSLWRKAEDFLEDQEALASKPYLRRVRNARADVAAGRVLLPFE